MIDKKLPDILPSSISEDNNIKAIASAVNNPLEQISSQIHYCVLLSDIDNQPEHIIDELAWHFHVDFYDNSLSLDKKRNLVKQSIPVHRKKGTPWAVEQVVSTAFKKGKIEEWCNYGGEPFRFKIEASGFNQSTSTVKQLVDAVNSTKNERSWLDGIVVDMNPDKEEEEAKLNIKVGIMSTVTGRKTIGLPDIPEANTSIKIGIANVVTGKKTIGIARPESAETKIYTGIILKRTGRITVGGIK